LSIGAINRWAEGTDTHGNGVTDPSWGFFNGTIDEVQIFNRSLFASEVQDLYNQGVYETKICCKNAGFGPAPGDVYWADMTGNPLVAPSNRADRNDTVKLVWKNTGLTSGTTVTFSIKEDNNPLGSDNIRDVTATVKNGDAVATWTITDADYNLGGGATEFLLLDNDEEFFFNVSGKTSGILLVDKDSSNNFEPVAVIVKPEDESKHLVGANLSFEQASYDIDDDLQVNWTFELRSSQALGNCLTGGNCNATHIYNNNGVKIVGLSAKESSIATRTQESFVARRIFLYLYEEGLNVFAVISEPNPKLDDQYVGAVNFNANLSYVANCSLTCPSGKSCYSVSDIVNGALRTLQCFDYSKSDISTSEATGKYNLWFNWTFDEHPFNRYGDWASNYSNSVEFTRAFYDLRNHYISLIVRYVGD
jgi:hypothetical protein